MSSAAGGHYNTAAIAATTVLVTVLATVAALSFLRFAMQRSRPQILQSPLRTLIPTLSKDELSKLDYSPDEFPGARDVVTPYGSIRVYEWGPESGPKVLMIHGISTSCQTLGSIAHALVRRNGCRVMLFDLFGRGFSDGPGDLPHDARLYVSQALLALASSPLRDGWTGRDARLRVIGYSMGGGVAVHLAPVLGPAIESLTLLAPAGLIRADKFGAVTKFIFMSGAVPERLLAAVTRRRLQRPISSGVKQKGGAADAQSSSSFSSSSSPRSSTGTPTSDGAAAAAGDPVVAALAEAAPGAVPLERRVLRYVQWMVTHHPGFLPAFMSCIRHAPLMGQQEAYERLAAPGAPPTAFILGRDDKVVAAEDYETDALPLVLGGRERGAVFWRVLGGGHDFPMTREEETVAAVEAFWSVVSEVRGN